jgi:hypothetical protein
MEKEVAKQRQCQKRKAGKRPASGGYMVIGSCLDSRRLIEKACLFDDGNDQNKGKKAGAYNKRRRA